MNKAKKDMLSSAIKKYGSLNKAVFSLIKKMESYHIEREIHLLRRRNILIDIKSNLKENVDELVYLVNEIDATIEDEDI